MDETRTAVAAPEGMTLIEATTQIVSAFVSRSACPAGEIPKLIADTHAALAACVNGPTEPTEPPAKQLYPAVPIRKSVAPDFIVCLEDGLKFRSLKRHLTSLGMTPDEYRAKWGLPADYPMVAPNYSATRSQMAKHAGLGRVGREVAN